MKFLKSVAKYLLVFGAFFGGLTSIIFVRAFSKAGDESSGRCALDETQLECAANSIWSVPAIFYIQIGLSLFFTMTLALRSYGVAKGYIESPSRNR